jgi:mannose-6-phosphate isomerase-like protein (cupin superfamily)
MPAEPKNASPTYAAIPADDLSRKLTVESPDRAGARHVAQAGVIYKILVSGDQTDGRYCLIDMLVPDGGGPPPHRHDFEEMFSLLEGELEFMFRDETIKVSAPATINIPANAPHAFRNKSGKSVHMLCMCTPAGQEEYFLAVADPIDSRNALPPALTPDEKASRRAKAMSLALQYRTEFLT